MTISFGDAVNVISFGVGFSGIVGRAYDTFVATSPSESLLEQCKTGLKEVEDRLGKLSPEERQAIYALAETRKYKRLETIERELRKLSSDRCELSELSAKASFVERSVPLLSKLLKDIKTLRNAIKELQSDTWNTTTSPNKEARKRAQARLEQGASEPQPPSPPVDPGNQSTNAQSPTIEPQAGEYQLDDLCPTTDHPAAREDATALPSGLV